MRNQRSPMPERRWTAWLVLVGLAAAQCAMLQAAGTPLAVTAVRFWSLSEVTRIAVETNGSFEYTSVRLEQPDRMFFDLAGTRTELSNGGTHIIPVNDGRVRQVRIAENQPSITRVVVDFTAGAEVEVSASQLSLPSRLMIEVRRKTSQAAPQLESRTPEKPAEPAAAASAKAFAFHGLAPATPQPIERLAYGSNPPNLVSSNQSGRRASSRPHPVVKAMATPQLDPPPGKFLIPRYRDNGSQAAAEAALDEGDELPAAAAPLVAVRKADPTANVPATAPVTAPTTTTDPPAKVMSGMPLAARSNSDGDRSLTRVLGLKVRRVVVDAGHGGLDFGTTGPGGLHEKDVTLDVAKRLGALIEERMGSEVIFTRSSDSFVPLESRPAMANARKADLFISVHANSSPLKAAVGVETYVLSLTPSKAAMDLAARENASSQRSVHELKDLVQKIAFRDKLEESREFANHVQKSLSAASLAPPAVKNRGVKRAPLVVLIGAQMPAVLAEIGFVSNTKEEQMLKRADYRQRLAEALYRGISQYADTLSHFEMAQGRTAGGTE